jgi:hypothetical protein
MTDWGTCLAVYEESQAQPGALKHFNQISLQGNQKDLNWFLVA